MALRPPGLSPQGLRSSQGTSLGGVLAGRLGVPRASLLSQTCPQGSVLVGHGGYGRVASPACLANSVGSTPASSPTLDTCGSRALTALGVPLCLSGFLGTPIS